ncbi:MAG TPA: recombinase family protein [Solirubrobacterales bacterium]|jgi:DNA invertase Pin-like site-specific DNA recombinase|nr:recombinase family protein [Solirubrobacterales bacterium]
MKPAILYAAKSTADKNASIPNQLRQGRELVEADGFTVCGSFKDENKSAYTGDRGPELLLAKDAAERLAQEHGECALVIQHSDRLARGDGKQAAHLVEYALWAMKAGVKILSIQDPETFQHEDLIYAVLTGKRNHDDSARKSKSVRGGIEKRAKEGFVTGGGRRRFGYRWKEDRSGVLLVVPHEAEVVDNRIYRATLEGTSGLQIMRELEADGIRTVTGARWHGCTVSQILRNPLYKGVVVYEGEEYPGQHEAIVDPDVWDAVDELMRSRSGQKAGRPRGSSQGAGGGRPTLGNHLFRKGMLKCVCGGSMVARTDRRKLASGAEAVYEYYECFNHHMDTSSCPVTRLRRDRVDPQVYRYFERVAVDVEATRAELAEALDARLAEVRALRGNASQEAQTAQERLDRVKRDYMDGTLTAEDWADFRVELTGELDAAKAQVQRFDSQLAEVEAGGATRDLEAEVVEKLAAIRAAVAGEVKDADGVDAARAALLRLFDGFILRDPQAGQRVPAELAWTGSGDYVLEPVLKDGVLPTPQPLHTSEATAITKNLFRPISLAATA